MAATIYPADQSVVTQAGATFPPEALARFFGSRTTVSREACDARARELAGGEVLPVEIQGSCSYTVYAGPSLEYVVQFRLKTLHLSMETAGLAKVVYGHLAPDVSFQGVMGTETQRKDPLYVYLMNRVPGMTYLFFLSNYGYPWHSPWNLTWRSTLMADVARFYALAWKQPQAVSQTYLDDLRQVYLTDLQRLQTALPTRFRSLVQYCVESLDAIMALPMVLQPPEITVGNMMVDPRTCRLMAVIDWAEAAAIPFGSNLHSLEAVASKYTATRGWIRFRDYDNLQAVFWHAFQAEVGVLSRESLRIISCSRILGLLRIHGFTNRLPHQPTPRPISEDDEDGRSSMAILDSVLASHVP